MNEIKKVTKLSDKLEKIKVLKDLEDRQKIASTLPHKFGRKLYPFQREFLDNVTDKIQLLCSANQIGKSAIGII